MRRLLFQGVRIKTVAAADRFEEAIGMALRPIPIREGCEDLVEANSEQRCGAELCLMAEQMEFHKQLIAHPSVERGDDMGERLMKRPFAVSNGLTIAQVETLECRQ